MPWLGAGAPTGFFRAMLARLGTSRPPIQAMPEFLVGDVRLDRCDSFERFQAYMAEYAPELAGRSAIEQSLVGPEPVFHISGSCPVCRSQVQFGVGYNHCFTAPDGRRSPNWREHLSCSQCGLNSRMRAAVALLSATAGNGRIYLTEQTTPLFEAVRERFPRVIGSEFLRDGTAKGATNAAGIRHEDLTGLTLPAGSVSCVATFDVLEHIPDYRAALMEAHRCLRPGGSLLMTVPFALDSPATVVRATLEPGGVVQHLLQPEYHVDPLDPGGTLCFYHFGWDLLETMARIGFDDAALYFYWSRDYGLLAGLQFVIHARRAAA